MNANFVDRMFSQMNSNYYNKNFKITVLYSKICEDILAILYKEGYINNYFINVNENSIDIYFKFSNNKSCIKKIRRISRGNRRVYLKTKDIKKILFDSKLGILSSSQGILTLDEALLKGIGGEFLCIIE